MQESVKTVIGDRHEEKKMGFRLSLPYKENQQVLSTSVAHSVCISSILEHLYHFPLIFSLKMAQRQRVRNVPIEKPPGFLPPPGGWAQDSFLKEWWCSLALLVPKWCIPWNMSLPHLGVYVYRKKHVGTFIYNGYSKLKIWCTAEPNGSSKTMESSGGFLELARMPHLSVHPKPPRKKWLGGRRGLSCLL